MKREQAYSESGFLTGESLFLSSRFCDIEAVAESSGGFSRVLRAKRMGKWHALKCLKPDYADKKEYRALLQKEFEIGYRLNHPNIAGIIGLEDVEGLGVCIVMEYVEGRTLRQAMSDEKWTRERIIRVMQQLGAALDYIHQQQVIHRDVKPENILLTTNGDHVKLIDFGFSDADSYAILKQPAGTPRYAAPEQMQQESSIDGRTDVYAMGIILGELCEQIPHRQTFRLRRIAAKCCHQQPASRYASASYIVWTSPFPFPWWAAAVMLCVMSAVWYSYFSSNALDSETTSPMRYRQTTKIVTEHDTIRVVEPQEPQKIYVPTDGFRLFGRCHPYRAAFRREHGLRDMESEP